RARLRDHEQRIGIAKSDAGDGATRRAETYRRIRYADRIFVQSRRLNSLSGDGFGVRRASGRNYHGLAHGTGSANPNDAYTYAHFQRRGRGAARIARDLASDLKHLPSRRPRLDWRRRNLWC